MSLVKSGISIECEQCHCLDRDDTGSFDVSVPLQDAETGVSGLARLQCRISSEAHQVEIVEWQDAESRVIAPPEELKKRLHKALDLISRQRVCGNRKICPADIIRIVESFNHSDD